MYFNLGFKYANVILFFSFLVFLLNIVQTRQLYAAFIWWGVLWYILYIVRCIIKGRFIKNFQKNFGFESNFKINNDRKLNKYKPLKYFIVTIISGG